MQCEADGEWKVGQDDGRMCRMQHYYHGAAVEERQRCTHDLTSRSARQLSHQHQCAKQRQRQERDAMVTRKLCDAVTFYSGVRATQLHGTEH